MPALNISFLILTLHKLILFSKVTDISKAMLIMELPAGANKEKKAIALRNLDHILEKAHAVRAPGYGLRDRNNCTYVFNKLFVIEI